MKALNFTTRFQMVEQLLAGKVLSDEQLAESSVRAALIVLTQLVLLINSQNQGMEMIHLISRSRLSADTTKLTARCYSAINMSSI